MLGKIFGLLLIGYALVWGFGAAGVLIIIVIAYVALADGSSGNYRSGRSETWNNRRNPGSW